MEVDLSSVLYCLHLSQSEAPWYETTVAQAWPRLRSQLIVLILYHIFEDPVLDMISLETGLILYNGGHSKGDKA